MQDNEYSPLVRGRTAGHDAALAGVLSVNADDIEVQKNVNRGPKFRPAKRGVSALQLTMMIYFFTSGGPFGIEAAVGAGGPLYTLIALAVIPLMWSLPQALMAAELSLMLSENGGNVIWVREAFGDHIGFFNALNNMSQSFVSLATLTVLFVAYIPGTLSTLEQWALKIGFVLLNVVLNILGLRTISRLSVAFLVFVLSPFFCEMILILMRHELDLSLLSEVPNSNNSQFVNAGVFLPTIIWSYGGFDSMGSLAGEVKGGRSSFLAGIVGSFPLIFVNYFLPISFGYSIQPDWTKWQTGYFTTIAAMMNTKWGYLNYWMIAASALSNFGQFNAAMAPLARVIWAMSRLGYLPGIIARASHQRKTGTVRPIGAIVFAGTIITCLCYFSYNTLVQFFLVIRVFNLFCEYAALVGLRYTRPEASRPFVVPGGKPVAILLGIPSAILAAYSIYSSPWTNWVAGMSVNVVIVTLVIIRYVWLKYHPRKIDPLIADETLPEDED